MKNEETDDTNIIRLKKTNTFDFKIFNLRFFKLIINIRNINNVIEIPNNLIAGKTLKKIKNFKKLFISFYIFYCSSYPQFIYFQISIIFK